MKKNMGLGDRYLRTIIAIVVMGLYYFEIIDGTLAIVLIALSGVLLLTSLFSFCPLYTLFGISSCKRNK